MKKIVIGIVIGVAISLVVGYTLGQQTNIRRTNSALAEIELTLAENERQQMEAQNLLYSYQLKLAQINQRYDAIWQSADAGHLSLGMANLEAEQLSRQRERYIEVIEEQAERLSRLQLEHEKLLKQKVELLRK
jgi:F0F1-type ATP synthase membrane subunit b/b'